MPAPGCLALLIAGLATEGSPRQPDEERDRWLFYRSSAHSYGGTVSGGPLVTIERTSRTSATVRLAPALAALRARSYVEVPDATFRLPQEGHHNPEGNPSPSGSPRPEARAATASTPGPGLPT